jgi:CelD/BcsL family acetyltransferase involved in cellulose biosynthesis
MSLHALDSVIKPKSVRVLSESGGALSLAVTPDLASIASDWRALQQGAPISPYQRFDLAETWTRRAADSAGVEPRIGVVRNAGDEVVMILPFGFVRRLGTAVAVYLGGSHFNVNLPLADPRLSLGPDTLTRIFDSYCRLTGADVLHLTNQPVAWRSAAHPFFCLPHQDAPDDVSLIHIKDGDFAKYVATELERKVRSELRRKAAKFAEAGAHMFRADTPDRVERCLDAFMRQKAKRLSTQGLDDPFAVPGIRAFFRDAALQGLTGPGGMEFHALQSAAGHLLAVRAGARHQDQHAMMVQSFDPDDPLAKFSPSEYLIAEVLEDGCRHGFTNFDFGVGANRFKKVWSNGAVGLFNVTHAASAKGQLYAGMMRLAGAATRYIKGNPKLFSAVQDARALTARLRGRVE